MKTKKSKKATLKQRKPLKNRILYLLFPLNFRQRVSQNNIRKGSYSNEQMNFLNSTPLFEKIYLKKLIIQAFLEKTQLGL